MAAQLHQARRDHGTHWIAYPVDANLVAERCDACGQRLESRDTIFDGARYLCAACFTPSI